MIETWFNQDVKKAVKVQYIEGNVFSMDNDGNKVGVCLFDGDNPVNVVGSISANVIRSDGATVAVSGSSSGNQAWVLIPQAACSVPGVISIIIKATSNDTITTLCAVVANVYQTSTDTVVDPGMIIPDIAALIASINQAIATVPLDYSELSNAFRDKTITEYGLSDPGTFENVNIGKVTGATTASTVYANSGYIPVTGKFAIYTTTPSPNATVLSNYSSISFYTEQSQSSFISAVGVSQGDSSTFIWQSAEIPSNAKYMRIMINQSLEGVFKCVQISAIKDIISQIATTYRGTVSSSDDIDNFLSPGMWFCYTKVGGLPSHWASTTIGTLLVFGTTALNNSGTQQYILDFNGQLWSRYKKSSGFTDWRKQLDDNDIITDILPVVSNAITNVSVTFKGAIDSSTDLDNLFTPGFYYCYSTKTAPVHYPSRTIGNIVVFATTEAGNNGTGQLVIDNHSVLYCRYKNSNGFTNWQRSLNDSDAVSMKTTPSTNYNVNTLTSPGMYSIGDVSLASNWPSSQTGRLIVFGDASSSTNRIVQVAVDNDYSFFFRYISAAVQRWVRLGTEERGTITSADDCNNFTRNGQFIVSSADAANWPSDKTGKLIVFGDENSDTNRIIQLAIDYQTNTFIRYKSSGWARWRSLTSSDSVRTVTVKASGGDFTTIPAAVKYVTDQFSLDSDQKWLIKIDPGTYDIADEVVDLISNGEINSQGLFINPNVTICGAGKDKTIIRFLYTGQDDNVMSNVSLFNMPYESALLDCTLICQNIRYCIHSALNAANMSTKYIDDVTIRCANVKMEHLGFDSQHTPTYSSPGCFGSGSTNGGKKEFYNCDFTANYTPWFNHNRKNLTKATEFIFEGCAFIRRNEGSSLNLITWIDDPQNYVTFRHCHINRYMSFSIRTDSLGDPNNKNGYYVTSDGDLIVAESTVNNSQLDDNYTDAYCQKLIAAEAITAYTPVSSNTIAGVRNYVSTDTRKGVALNSVASGDVCCVKLGGHMLLNQLTSTVFAVGKNLGWNGSAWIEDNTNPIVKVVYSGVVEIL